MHPATTSSRHAVRWAAIGAAVAVTLGAGSIGIARATAPTGAAAYVPITPCRLFDTRPASAVGPRTSPLGPDETFTITATGPQGNCDVPAAATGLALNVTAVAATNDTFLTVWPAGQTRPTASSLNPTAGAPPVPNAVTTNLGAGGAFSVFNRFGSVHVLADAVGYYTDHTHDDRYYTEAEVNGLVAAAKAEAIAAAPAAWTAIPSGVTVTGVFGFNSSTTGSLFYDYLYLNLPGIPPVPLTDSTVNFGGMGENDQSCTGDDDAPTAPPGRLCLYGTDGLNVGQFAGERARGARGFAIRYAPINTSPGLDMYLYGTWAYTAP